MLRQAEIPVEHAISLPLPTKRLPDPGYVFFASPAIRSPKEPIEQGAPDRWWVVDARNGRLMIYALWKVMPFDRSVSWTTQTLPIPVQTLEEQQAALESIESLIDTLAVAFFTNEAGEQAMRKALLEALETFLPAPLLPQYRTFAPDFFAWLEV
jgi:hypothetical protein